VSVQHRSGLSVESTLDTWIDAAARRFGTRAKASLVREALIASGWADR
jgi:hypothetical protein